MLEKWFTGELKIREGSPRQGIGMVWGLSARRELMPCKQMIYQREKPRALGSTLGQAEEGKRGAVAREETAEAAELGERG